MTVEFERSVRTFMSESLRYLHDIEAQFQKICRRAVAKIVKPDLRKGAFADDFVERLGEVVRCDDCAIRPCANVVALNVVVAHIPLPDAAGADPKESHDRGAND